MAINNKLRKILDQPVWEWMRFSPFTSAATTTMYTTPSMDTGSWQNRYIYATSAVTLYRYDTYSDSWSTINSSLPTSPASTVGGTWNTDDGHYGNMLNAYSGSTIATGSFINESAVIGRQIKIIGGKGAGQIRKIVSASQPINHEYLTVTMFTNSGTAVCAITDSSKKWVINQWKNYQLRVYLGTSQQYFVRKVLFNNNDTLFFANAEWHVIDPHQAYNHIWDADVINPAANASRAVIQSSTLEVDSPWNVSLDKTSKYMIRTGTIQNVQNISSNALFLNYWYDPIYASWFPNHVMTGVLPSYLAATELGLESINSKMVPAFITGSISSATRRTVTDSTQNWRLNQWANYKFVDSNNGIERTIINNTKNTLIFKSDLDLTPKTGDIYKIIVDDDKMYINGGNFSTMAQYSLRNNSYFPSQRFEDGVANVAYTRYSSSIEMQFPISTITRSGNIATVTTITGHPFVDGDRVYISGSVGSDSQYYNGYFTVTGSYSLSTSLTSTNQPTQFTYWMSGTPSANATLNAHSTTVVYDTSKQWNVNEWNGSVLQIWSSSPTAPTTQYRVITANTGNSITVTPALSSITTGVWGYNILSSASFGASDGLDNSFLTGTGSYTLNGRTTNAIPFIYYTASLIDTINKIPIGAPVTGSGIPNGTFYRSYQYNPNRQFVSMSISQNATSTQGSTQQDFQLFKTRGYGRATGGTASTLVDAGKTWPTNFWVGARIRFLAGTGAGQETSITSNTNNTITFGTTNSANATTATPDTSTVYSIIPIQPRNTTSTISGVGGADIKWVYGRGSEITLKENLGKYIYCFQAASTMRFEKYNINTMQYEFPFIMPFSHQLAQNLSTGTMYAYDGKGRIYIQPNSSAHILYIDTDYDRSESAGQIPVGMSTARQGRRFWIKTDESGLDYQYIMRHNDTSFFRQLTFF